MMEEVQKLGERRITRVAEAIAYVVGDVEGQWTVGTQQAEELHPKAARMVFARENERVEHRGWKRR
jgi:hypothetical protein